MREYGLSRTHILRYKNKITCWLIRTESQILSLYGRIQVSLNPYSRIFYVVKIIKQMKKMPGTVSKFKYCFLSFKQFWNIGLYFKTVWRIKKIFKFLNRSWQDINVLWFVWNMLFAQFLLLSRCKDIL